MMEGLGFRFRRGFVGFRFHRALGFIRLSVSCLGFMGFRPYRVQGL